MNNFCIRDNKCEVINKKETTTIMCSNPSCKKELLIVHQENKNNISYRLRVECPFCLRRSYDFDVVGDLKWVVCKEVLIVDYIEDDKNNIVIVKTRAK